MDDKALLEVLGDAADEVRSALDGLSDWRAAGDRPGQYRLDIVADAAALSVLHGAGLPVLSEESGITEPDDRVRGDRGTDSSGPDVRPAAGEAADTLFVVLDPVDGSTNASLGIPWFSTSLCVVDAGGPRVALVVNQASGVRYHAVRGAGARRDDRPIAPSACTEISRAVIGISGFPRRHPGWSQFRALGSAALDHCAVADGSLDGYLPVGGAWLHVWDYLGGSLICAEAGAAVGELRHNDLVVRDDSHRWPVAAATPDLLEDLRSIDG